MSWSQIKKRFEELEAYLGKDKEGIKRLKLLKDEVNVLRTDLATAKEETQLANAIKDAARERADAAETVVAEMQIHAKSNELKIQSMRRRVEALSQEISKLSGDEDKVAVERADPPRTNASEVTRVLKALRRKKPICPEPVRQSTDLITKTEFFDRNDLATGWSHENLWILGASVAVLSLYLGQIVVFSSEIFGDDSLPGGDDFFKERYRSRYIPQYIPQGVGSGLDEAGLLTVDEIMRNRDGLRGDMS